MKYIACYLVGLVIGIFIGSTSLPAHKSLTPQEVRNQEVEMANEWGRGYEVGYLTGKNE